MDVNKVAHLYELRAQIKALETEEKALANEIKANAALDTYPVGPFKVDITPNRRFDAKIAESVLSESEFRKASKRTVDAALLKALFPEKYSLAQRDYGTRISVTIPED